MRLITITQAEHKRLKQLSIGEPLIDSHIHGDGSTEIDADTYPWAERHVETWRREAASSGT